MKTSILPLVLAGLLGATVAGIVVHEAFPRTVREVVAPAEPITIDLSDSTRAAIEGEYEEQLAAAERLLTRFRDRVQELEARPPVRTVDTTIVEVPVEAACEPGGFEPRWRLTELVVGEDVGDETLVRSELIEPDSASVVFRPRVERHVTAGPVVGAFPTESGMRIAWGEPPPEPCDFWCRMGLRAQGGAVGALATALACVGG